MPSIPSGLTKQHILLALADLKAGIPHPFGQPSGYELVHSGKRYAPKAAIGLAVQKLTGQMLGPDDFSGGEAPGQANYVLRKLGFEVVEKASATRKGFVTSRSFALPTDADKMAELLWFNMWRRRLWPYRELEKGDTLYWYDTKNQAIVWKSRVIRVERFEYANKRDVRKKLLADFKVSELTAFYFDSASDQGYCLAFKIDSVVRLNVPKPAGHKSFPQDGWLRCSDGIAQEWLKNLLTESPDGPTADAISKATVQVTEAGYFSLVSLKDERTKKLCEIVERRGQPDFRNKLIAAYGGGCAVTGCNAVAALEAAHIIPYCGPQSHHVTNGVLLRADIHTLFDLNLIGIHPEALTIALAPTIMETSYRDLEGEKLRLPASAADAPSHEALKERWKQFGS